MKGPRAMWDQRVVARQPESCAQIEASHGNNPNQPQVRSDFILPSPKARSFFEIQLHTLITFIIYYKVKAQFSDPYSYIKAYFSLGFNNMELKSCVYMPCHVQQSNLQAYIGVNNDREPPQARSHIKDFHAPKTVSLHLTSINFLLV